MSKLVKQKNNSELSVENIIKIYKLSIDDVRKESICKFDGYCKWYLKGCTKEHPELKRMSETDCKYGSNCTKKNCPYKHSEQIYNSLFSKSNFCLPVGTPVEEKKKKITNQICTQGETCRFYQIGECRYQHPNK